MFKADEEIAKNSLQIPPNLCNIPRQWYHYKQLSDKKINFMFDIVILADSDLVR